MAINWISSYNNVAKITLDSQGRIYISSHAMKLMGIKRGAPFHLALGYDADEKHLVAAKPSAVKTDAEPFKFDTRAYCKKAANVLDNAKITGPTPIHFVLVGDGEASKQPGLAYPEGVFAFVRRQ